MSDKTCSMCREVKSTDQFTKRALSRDGLSSCCRDCKRKSRNREREAETSRLWLQRNKERRRKVHAAWREKNPGKKEAATAAWRLTEAGWLSRVMANARSRAKKRGLPFSITKDDLKALMVSHCPALGIELIYHNAGGNRFNSASLDRIIPSHGYVPGNIAVISYKANRMKSDSSVEEFMSLARWITENATREEACA
jgi:hypothetical protein